MQQGNVTRWFMVAADGPPVRDGLYQCLVGDFALTRLLMFKQGVWSSDEFGANLVAKAPTHWRGLDIDTTQPVSRVSATGQIPLALIQKPQPPAQVPAAPTKARKRVRLVLTPADQLPLSLPRVRVRIES